MNPQFNSLNIDKQHFLPKSYFEWVLFFFIISAMNLYGQGQLRILGIIIAVSYLFFHLKHKYWFPPEMIVFFIWTVWAVSTGYIICVDKVIFFRIAIVVTQIMIMSIAISGITAYRGNLNVNFMALCIGGIIFFIPSILAGDLQAGIDPEEQIRAQGITSNANFYAYLLLLAISGLLYFWKNEYSLLKKALFVMVITLFLAGIMFSGSRKTFIAFIILIIMWLLMCYGAKLLKRPIFIIGILIIISSLYLTTNYMLTETFMGKRFQKDFIEDPITDRRKGYHRLIFIEEGFQMINENPVFGVGLGNFRTLSVLGKESHSDYIEVAASTGIIGFLIYYSIYFLLWRRMSRIQKLTNNKSILYTMGLLKAIVVMLLFIGLGRAHMTSQLSWIMLSSAIGYTWSLEKRLKLTYRLQKSLYQKKIFA